MKLELAEILNLEGIEVENYCNLGKELVIDVEMKGVKATCPRSGNISHNLHQNHHHLIRDLPLSNREVFLRVNRRQFKCQICQKPFSEELHFVEKRKKFTKRYASFITQQLNSSSPVPILLEDNR